MYENANDVSLKNDIYVHLKFYKYMYTSIGIKLLAVLNIQHVEHIFYRFFFNANEFIQVLRFQTSDKNGLCAWDKKSKF